jgi:hypothetical protein
MTIQLKREGGFVGIADKANVEFEQLTTDEQNVLNKLAESSIQAAENSENHNLRDAFSYSIALKKGGKNVSLKFNDITAPSKIIAIFQKCIH